MGMDASYKRLMALLALVGALYSPSLIAEEIIPAAHKDVIQLVWPISNSRDKSVLLTVIGQFEKANKVRVNIIYDEASSMAVNAVERFVDGISPDVVVGPSDIVGVAGEINASVVPDAMLSSATPSLVKTTAVLNGKTYGVPLFWGNHLVLYYNKKLVGQPASKWEQLYAQSESFGDKGIDTIGWNFYEGYFLVPFITAFNAWPITDGKISINSKGTVNALNYYRNLATSGVINPRCNYGCVMGKFTSDKLAYMMNGDWAFSELRELMKNELGVAKLPTIAGVQSVSMSASFLMLFPDGALAKDKGDLLRKLAAFFATDEVQRSFFENGARIPVNPKIYQDVLTGEHADPLWIQMIANLESSRPMPSSPAMAHVWRALNKGLNSVTRKSVDLEQLAARLQQEAERNYAATTAQDAKTP